MTGNLDSGIKLPNLRIPILALVASVGLLACDQSEKASDPVVAQLPEVAASGSAEPHLATTNDGIVVMSWLEPLNDRVALRWSKLDGGRWSKARTIASGDNWFVNWADFPSVEPIDNATWAAHWLVKRPGGTYAYDVTMAISQDSGDTWSEPFVPHQDGTPTEHGFVSLFPWNGDVGALWLDGRDTEAAGDSHGHGGMTLRAAAFGADLERLGEARVDDLVCDCCQTDVAVSPSGPVAVYRNRTDDEIRDIYVARLLDERWGEGAPVANDGWEINGCPVNGPAIAAKGERIGVAWFTAAGNETKVRFAHSVDSGAKFGKPIDIATERPIGRVDTVLLDDGTALVSWLRDAKGTAGEICVRSVRASGELGPIQVISTTAAGRMSGFPQMVLRGDDVVFAWTDVSEGTTQVYAAVAPVEMLSP